jgi:phosphomannomutase/phosphoglucomutase
LVGERERRYPCSGEINYRVDDANAAMNKVEEHFSALNPQVDRTDGVGLAFDNWRLNLRSSNTEPLLRLNVESRSEAGVVLSRVREIEKILGVHA